MAYIATNEDITNIAAQEIEDRIELVQLAIEKFAVALMRCSAVGTESTITVPDEETAKIFRAALEGTSKTKPAHRLIDVVVDNG